MNLSFESKKLSTFKFQMIFNEINTNSNAFHVNDFPELIRYFTM